MSHVLGIWNGEMLSLSSGSLGLSSGTFPFSISTFPSTTCVSTPLADCTNFWRFQEKDTKSKSTRAGALHHARVDIARVHGADVTSEKQLYWPFEQNFPSVPLWWWADWPCGGESWVQNGWWPWRGGRLRETWTLRGWRSWSRPPSPPSRCCRPWWAWLGGSERTRYSGQTRDYGKPLC